MNMNNLETLNKLSNNITTFLQDISTLVDINKKEKEITTLQTQLKDVCLQIEKLKKKCLRDTIKDFTNELNKEFQDKGLISNRRGIVNYYEDDLVLFKKNIGDNIYICNPKVLKVLVFPKDLSIKDKFELFCDNKEKIKEETYEMAKKIYKNRIYVSKILKEIVKKLSKEYNLDINSFKIQQECYYSDSEGIETITVEYKNSFLFSRNVFLYMDLNYEDTKESLFEYLKLDYEKELSKIEEKKLESKKDKIRNFLHSVNTPRKVFIKIVNNYVDCDKLYDLSKGIVSIYFDIEDKKLTRKFKNDVETEVNKILLFEKIHSLKEVSVRNASLGNDYFFIKEKTFKDEDGIYDFYICKGTNRRTRLHIFLNDLRISSARQRRKILKKYGNNN